MDIVLWLIVGAAVGGIGRAFAPGRALGGTIGAVAIGAVGGLVGGFLLRVVFDASTAVSLVGAAIGAVAGVAIDLFAMRASTKLPQFLHGPGTVEEPVEAGPGR